MYNPAVVKVDIAMFSSLFVRLWEISYRVDKHAWLKTRTAAFQQLVAKLEFFEGSADSSDLHPAAAMTQSLSTLGIRCATRLVMLKNTTSHLVMSCIPTN